MFLRMFFNSPPIAGCRPPLLVTLMVACIALAGCAPMVEVDNPADSDLMEVELPLAQQNPLLSDAVMPAQWWQLFGDDTLNWLEQQAVEASPERQLAALQVAAQVARLGLVESQGNPQLGMGAEYSRSGISENSPNARIGGSPKAHDYWELGVQASWELDLFGYLDQLEQGARERAMASRFNQQAVAISNAAAIARHYMLLRVSEQQLRWSQQRVALYQTLVELTQSRVRNGVATETDVAKVQAQLASAQADLAPLRQQRERQQNLLEQMLGLKPHALDQRLASGVSLPQLPEAVPVGIPSSEVRKRPDILRAEAQLKAALADLGAAQADFYPRLRLTGSYDREAFELNDLGSWGSRAFSVGPSLYLPIFQGGRLRRTLELADVSQQQAAIRYVTTVLDAWHEVDDALNTHQLMAQRYTRLNEALERQREAYTRTEHAEDEGYASRMDVLQAQLDLIARSQQQAAGQTEAALSIVSLYRSLGGGWQQQALETGDSEQVAAGKAL
ncbi:NodT family efflux transporter outer membrane factor (OMF) lipoprotein [Marinobacterium mangrovicola]|uniref:NodT family efflux transporter outer membrane factor (OMF) lipoprotein n=1 Tax=Marinobacterium mangrovicola TaxID=1476959 RepID=A0A4R1GNR4_9GAMM|nr:NodT family efflux transporter outer membrane factor (OMF) lipoprotein [Marinobacterium mangrovicola]